MPWFVMYTKPTSRHADTRSDAVSRREVGDRALYQLEKSTSGMESLLPVDPMMVSESGTKSSSRLDCALPDHWKTRDADNSGIVVSWGEQAESHAFMF